MQFKDYLHFSFIVTWILGRILESRFHNIVHWCQVIDCAQLTLPLSDQWMFWRHSEAAKVGASPNPDDRLELLSFQPQTHHWVHVRPECHTTCAVLDGRAGTKTCAWWTRCCLTSLSSLPVDHNSSPAGWGSPGSVQQPPWNTAVTWTQQLCDWYNLIQQTPIAWCRIGPI